MALSDFITAFLLGLGTPLGAVCVLPLYPGFLGYLASQIGTGEKNKWKLFSLGLIVVSGVILFMITLGLIFTTLLQESLTSVIQIVSPIAFFILLLISILLIFNFDFGKFFPQIHSPVTKNPFLSAFLFGLFFGAIVLPCNPGFITAFFARELLVTDFFSSMISFVLFGLGIGFPLLILSGLSASLGDKVIKWFTEKKRWINLTVGILLFYFASYELLVEFNVFGISKYLGFLLWIFRPIEGFLGLF